MAFRIAAGFIGAFYLIQGIQWIADPASSAEALGMPLLDGLGRSTQIGDMASFFLSLGTMCLLGAIRSSSLWVYGGAMLLGWAAIVRTLAWSFHDASFAGVFIGVELVSAGLLIFIGTRFDAAGARND